MSKEKLEKFKKLKEIVKDEELRKSLQDKIEAIEKGQTVLKN